MTTVYRGTLAARNKLHGLTPVRARRASLLSTGVLGAAVDMGAGGGAIGSEIMSSTITGQPSLVLTVC